MLADIIQYHSFTITSLLLKHCWYVVWTEVETQLRRVSLNQGPLQKWCYSQWQPHTSRFCQSSPLINCHQPIRSQSNPTQTRSESIGPQGSSIIVQIIQGHHLHFKQNANECGKTSCFLFKGNSSKMRLFFYKTFQVKVPCIESPANVQSIESFHTVTRLGFPTALLKSRALRQQVTSAVGRVSFI